MSWCHGEAEIGLLVTDVMVDVMVDAVVGHGICNGGGFCGNG